MELPIGQPVGVPSPIPFWAVPGRMPNPNADPMEQPHRGPKPRPRPAPYPRPRVAPGTLPAQAPYGDPVVVTNPRGGPRGDPRPRPVPGGKTSPILFPRTPRGYDAPAPPPKGVRERKVQGGPGLARALRAAMAATEWGDAIDAIFQALPRRYKRGVRGGAEKALAIWRHFGDVNLPKAVVNLISNQVEDWIIGHSIGAIPKGGFLPFNNPVPGMNGFPGYIK